MKTPKTIPRRGSLNTKKNFQLFLLAAPAITLIFIFSYLPMAGIVIAFKNINYVDGIFGSPWVGLDNFNFLFTADDTWSAIRNTLGYNIASIFLGNAVAVMFAVFLHELTSRRFIKYLQTTFFFPFFFSWIIVSYMVYSFFSGKPAGVLVNLLMQVGIDITDFYLNPAYWPAFLIFLGIWKGLGQSSIIYYAAIMGLPTEFNEAAAIDGADKRQIVRYIVLPQIIPVISILVLLAIGRIFCSDFGLFYFVPKSVPQTLSATQTIDTYVYRLLRTSGDVSMSAAAGLFQSVMSCLLVLLSNFIVKRVNPENAIF